MTCGFCGSRNSIEEPRCRKCGRKPGDTLTGDIVLHQTNGQLAMQVQVQAVEAPSRRESRRPYQASLFQAASNVIPIEAYAPVEPRPRQQRTEAAPAKSTRNAPRRNSRVPEGQGTLDFLASAPLK